MSLQQGMPAGSGLRFRDSFENTLAVMDQSGVIVNATVDRGISPLGANARVTYDQTQALLINATQMTIAMRFKMFGVNNASSKNVLAKAPSALDNNQFFIQFDSNRILDCYIANAAGDFSQSFRITSALTLGAEYVVHAVYNGGLAVGSRGVWYSGGLAVGTSITGTLPASMLASPSPLTLLNRYGGSTLAPANDFLLRSVRIYDFSMGAEEVKDDFEQDMASEITVQ